MTRALVIVWMCGCALATMTARTHAQSCCGKLDVPLAGTERAANREGQVMAGVAYELGLSHDGFTEQGFGITRADTHTLTVDASYGITNWLTAGFAVPLMYKRYAALVDGESVSRDVFGVGDALVLAKFAWIGNGAFAPGALRLWVAPGVKLPTGPYQTDDDYGRLPAAAQLGSGSFDGVGAAFASIGLDGEGSKALLLASVVGRFTTENSEGFRAGHSIESTIYVTSSHIEHWGLRIGPQLRIGARASQNEVELANTGAIRLGGRAGAAYSLSENTSLTADIQVPIYGRVHGDQLDPLLAAGIGLLATYP